MPLSILVTQHNDIQHNCTQYTGIQHYDFQHKINFDAHHNATQHTGRLLLYWVSFMWSSTNQIFYAECHYALCLYAECHYAECLSAECRGALLRISAINLVTLLWCLSLTKILLTYIFAALLDLNLKQSELTRLKF
jgi:hypothetical protein